METMAGRTLAMTEPMVVVPLRRAGPVEICRMVVGPLPLLLVAAMMPPPMSAPMRAAATVRTSQAPPRRRRGAATGWVEERRDVAGPALRAGPERRSTVRPSLYPRQLRPRAVVPGWPRACAIPAAGTGVANRGVAAQPVPAR